MTLVDWLLPAGAGPVELVFLAASALLVLGGVVGPVVFLRGHRRRADAALGAERVVVGTAPRLFVAAGVSTLGGGLLTILLITAVVVLRPAEPVFAISLYASFGVGMVGTVALIPWSLQRFTRGQLVLSHDGLSWTLDGHGGAIAFTRPFELARFSGGEDPSAEVPGAWLCLELRQEGQAVTVSVRVPPERVAGLPVREGHPRGHEPRWLGVLLVDEIERRARTHQAGPGVPVAAGQAVLPAVTDGFGPGGRLA